MAGAQLLDRFVYAVDRSRARRLIDTGEGPSLGTLLLDDLEGTDVRGF